jgi:hypothetical protein
VKDFAPYLSDATEIINRNLDHPGVIQAIELFSIWMRLASQGIPCPAQPFFERLAALGVPPIQLVRVAGAAYWFAHDNPRRILTVRHRAFFVANQLFRTEHPGGSRKGYGYPRQATSKDRAAAGNYVHEHLKTLMVNIVCACQNKEKEAAKRIQEQYAPLRG